MSGFFHAPAGTIPVLLSYKNENGAAGEGRAAHDHFAAELICIAEGKATLTLGSDTYLLGAGQLALVDAGIPHSLSGEAFSRIEARLGMERVTGMDGLSEALFASKSVCELLTDRRDVLILDDTDGSLLAVLRQLGLYASDADTLSQASGTLTAQQLLILLALARRRELAADPWKTAQKLLEENAAVMTDGRPYTPELLARQMKIPRMRLDRCCTRLTGQTVSAYLNDFRAERTKALLESGLSLNAAAEKLGFADPFAVTRVFRARYGITPGEYRMRLLKEDKR